MILHKKLYSILWTSFITVHSIVAMDLPIAHQVPIPFSSLAGEAIAHIPATFATLPDGAVAYCKTLPRINKHITNTAQAITHFLCEFSNTRGGKIKLKDLDILQNKILTYINSKTPISCILVGFPGKSSNNETKVLQSKTIDMAECMALLTLYHICQEIHSIYTPGMTIGLWSREAHIYSLSNIIKKNLGIDLYNENDIEEYQKDLQSLVTLFNPSIKLINIENTRKIFEEHYAQLQVEPAYNIKGYEAFMKEELNQDRIRDAIFNLRFPKIYDTYSEKQGFSFIKPYNSWQSFKQGFEAGSISEKQFKKLKSLIPINNTMSTLSHDLADAVVIGSSRNRALLTDSIPNYSSYVRLSVSPNEDGSVASKLGISLIYGSTGTPWHNVLAIGKNGIKLTKLSDITDKRETLNGMIKQYALENLKLAYVELN